MQRPFLNCGMKSVQTMFNEFGSLSNAGFANEHGRHGAMLDGLVDECLWVQQVVTEESELEFRFLECSGTQGLNSSGARGREQTPELLGLKPGSMEFEIYVQTLEFRNSMFELGRPGTLCSNSGSETPCSRWRKLELFWRKLALSLRAELPTQVTTLLSESRF